MTSISDLMMDFMSKELGVEFVDVTPRCRCGNPATWKMMLGEGPLWCDTCVPDDKSNVAKFNVWTDDTNVATQPDDLKTENRNDQ